MAGPYHPESTTAVSGPTAGLDSEQQQQQQLLDSPLDEMHDDQDEQDQDQEQDQEQDYESSSSPSTTTSTLTWITWFCSLPGHEYFCEVAEDFIEDDFNLTGLSGLVPFYKEAMEMVLDVEAEDESHRVPDVSIVESSAELLYGLIHQRFIITRQGLQQMYAKFDAAHFGLCPRVYCTQQKLLPCGRSDLPGVDTVKLYCPNCVDMYVPPSSRFQGVDGAFFGTTFPHLLFQTYPIAFSLPPPAPAPAPTSGSGSTKDLREPTNPLTSLSKVYVPRIYGFKVSERARSGPRMQWLRMRPRVEGELDWADADELHQSDDDEEAGGEERVTGAFDSGPEEEEDDEEDVSEEEEGGQGGEKKVGEEAPDAMKEATVGIETIKKDHPADRPMKALPRSSPAKSNSTTFVSTVATSTFDAATVKRDIEAAKARAAELVKGIARPETAVLGNKPEGKGMVNAVKSVVA